MEQRTCPVCGEQFLPTAAHQRFCPPTERDRAVAGPRQARSRCRRRALNVKRTGGDPAARPLPAPFDCARCGKHCVPGQNADPKATRFCGYRCKRAHIKGIPTRRERARAKLARAAAGICAKTVWYDRVCPECGERSLSRARPSDEGGYCSRTCARRQKCRRRRARERGVTHGALSFWRVAERDGWSCGICGGPVDASLRVPDLYAPTLDHVIPLALGGPHSLENGQLAHLICNSRKGAALSG